MFRSGDLVVYLRSAGVGNLMLRLQMKDHFSKMGETMPEAVFIPVGANASRGVERLTKEGFLNKERVLHVPHIHAQGPQPARRTL